jgi:hypothetical protein
MFADEGEKIERTIPRISKTTCQEEVPIKSIVPGFPGEYLFDNVKFG